MLDCMRPFAYLGLVLVHSSWIFILSAYFVIDQTELREAGFFANDKEYSSTAGLILSWSLPIIGFLMVLYLKKKKDAKYNKLPEEND